MEQIFSDLPPLVRSGQLKIDECFHQAIEDWFHYVGRTFDVQSYEHYKIYKERRTRGASWILNISSKTTGQVR
ncbi:hypothetical protein BDDG_12531 [Blastomyces dermatitidis ATCC 18188]|uniref:Uncharacterized protein n=1 Tax=Ajellomyces dermatitidis (strain ATCC 18188 / CBS 674.68) TaxID=653446 RepID=A0A0J9EPT5_AJEDA|nr:hypothetical protein BDDG_12531 [Blastomyces dermatitidis ATCC 18188]